MGIEMDKLFTSFIWSGAGGPLFRCLVTEAINLHFQSKCKLFELNQKIIEVSIQLNKFNYYRK